MYFEHKTTFNNFISYLAIIFYMHTEKRFASIVLLLLFLDVLTKQIIRAFQIQTHTGIVDITFTTNTGTMWSLFSGAQSINIVFIILSFVAIGFLYWYKKQEPTHDIPIAILFAGIFGNLIDRIVHGAVIDWINFYFFPIFNIADSCIVIGVVILIFQTIQQEKRQGKK